LNFGEENGNQSILLKTDDFSRKPIGFFKNANRHRLNQEMV
jgi:hypothetical protein